MLDLRRIVSRLAVLALTFLAVGGCGPPLELELEQAGGPGRESAVSDIASAGARQPGSCFDRCYRRHDTCVRKAPADPVDSEVNRVRALCSTEWSTCLAGCLNGAGAPSAGGQELEPVVARADPGAALRGSAVSLY